MTTNPRFQAGDRIKVRRSWSDIDGAVGTIAIPPDPVQASSGFGAQHYRRETTLTGGETTIYWVELDPTYPGQEAIEAGEFNDSELEKL